MELPQLVLKKIDTTNIDAVITGSQKALMLPPGLSMIGLSNKAVEKKLTQDQQVLLKSCSRD